MPVYSSSEQLISSMKTLFDQIQQSDATAVQSVSDSRLLIRLRLASPAAVIFINGRKSPVRITYNAAPLQPDLDIDLDADLLHGILLDQVSLRKAVLSGQVKVRGPVWKSFVLEGIFRRGQQIYPRVLQDLGLNGRQTL